MGILALPDLLQYKDVHSHIARFIRGALSHAYCFPGLPSLPEVDFAAALPDSETTPHLPVH
jgi:hypothetical protein